MMICVVFEVNFVYDNRSRLDAHLLLFKTCLQLMQLLTIIYDYKAAILQRLFQASGIQCVQLFKKNLSNC